MSEAEQQAVAFMKAITKEDGSLDGLVGRTGYIKWAPGDPYVGIEGELTSAELYAIADHMDHYEAPSDVPTSP